MEIHELTERQSTLDTGVYLPVDDGDVTQKIDYPRLAQAIIEQYTASSLGGSYRSIKTALDAIKTTVDGKVNTSDVVNNVVTTAAGKVLDARQGNTLNDAINTLSTKLTGYIIKEDINFSGGFSAGTPGTRGWQGSVDDPHPSGYQIIGIAVMGINNSAVLHPMAFYYVGKIYCNFYRATTTAVTNETVTVRVVYRAL